MKILISTIITTLFAIQGCSSNTNIIPEKKIIKNTPHKTTNKRAINPLLTKIKKQNIKKIKPSNHSTSSHKINIKKKTISSNYTKKRIYTCSNLSKSEAYSLLKSGHTYLDRDADGHPCEWGKKKISTYIPSSKSNCHYVKGYYRKSGTYVRGHKRCK